LYDLVDNSSVAAKMLRGIAMLDTFENGVRSTLAERRRTGARSAAVSLSTT